MDTQIDKWFNKNFPLNVAQKWDNVGLLIPSTSKGRKILVTVDLTPEVIQECIDLNVNHVICYHPVIFPSIKKIDKNLQKLISRNISIYCPHTSLDYYLCSEFGKSLNSKTIYKNDAAVINGFPFVTTGKSLLKLLKSNKILQNESAFRIIYPCGMNNQIDFENTILNSCIIGVGASQDEFKDLVVYLNDRRNYYEEVVQDFSVRIQEDLKKGSCSDYVIDENKSPIDFKTNANLQNVNQSKTNTLTTEVDGATADKGRSNPPDNKRNNTNTPTTESDGLMADQSLIIAQNIKQNIFLETSLSIEQFRTDVLGAIRCFPRSNGERPSNNISFNHRFPTPNDQDLSKIYKYQAYFKKSPLWDLCTPCHNFVLATIIMNEQIHKEEILNKMINLFNDFHINYHNKNNTSSDLFIESTLSSKENTLGQDRPCVKYESDDDLKSIFNLEAVQYMKMVHDVFFSTNKYNLLITGEMRHHDMLFYRNNKTIVILLEHSRIERVGIRSLADLLKNEFDDVVVSNIDKDPVSFILNS